MHNLKKIIFLFNLLIWSFCFSQIKNINVQYGLLLNNVVDQMPGISTEFKESITKNNLEAMKVQYTLNANNAEAYFFANPILEESKFTLSNLVTFGFGKLKYYQNKSSNEHREFVDYMRTGSAILNKEVFYDWTLTNEIKNIDGRKCIKAISPNINSKGVKSTDHKFDITAWYTPEIPVSFGPMGYGGLPGLIVELHFYANTFYAKRIILNPDKEPVIDKLTSMPAISEEELNARAMSTLSKGQLEMMKEADAKNKEEKK